MVQLNNPAFPIDHRRLRLVQRSTNSSEIHSSPPWNLTKDEDSTHYCGSIEQTRLMIVPLPAFPRLCRLLCFRRRARPLSNNTTHSTSSTKASSNRTILQPVSPNRRATGPLVQHHATPAPPPRKRRVGAVPIAKFSTRVDTPYVLADPSPLPLPNANPNFVTGRRYTRSTQRKRI
ncbi:hypothetical protein K402DRAFT_185056 [Aulographum hederae CBS 113979]|uniref:Uncharacterized protein n=1 Tax=Aulographum hederae CBS 113979 TaxID=1176131 RepID=A0A6G1GQD4_9PEZI|nr:hypothetical protein K402DRAFT_185056 [Aulographum hederae CBS 113979]